MLLLQQSKATWLRLGDDNTGYVHAVIKHKRLRQAVMQLKDESETRQTDPEVIANIFVDFYKTLIGR